MIVCKLIIALDSALNHSKVMDGSHQVLTPTLTVDAPVDGSDLFQPCYCTYGQ